VGESFGLPLKDVLHFQSEGAPIADPLSDSFVEGSENNRDVPDASLGKVLESVEEDRLVRNGNHVLVATECERPKAGSMPSGKDEALHVVLPVIALTTPMEALLARQCI